jgi:hypothetical protein
MGRRNAGNEHMIRVVQLKGPRGRRVARVDEPRLTLLEGCQSVYELAQMCLAEARNAGDLVAALAGRESLSYDEVYAGTGDWRLLPSADHPYEPARCLVSGTGLTHSQRQEPAGDARKTG